MRREHAMVEEPSQENNTHLTVQQTRVTALIYDVDVTYEGLVLFPNCWLPEEYLSRPLSSRAFYVAEDGTTRRSVVTQRTDKAWRFIFSHDYPPHTTMRDCQTFILLADRGGRPELSARKN